MSTDARSGGPATSSGGTSEPPALALRHITAGYDQTSVLHDVSLEVPARSVVALIGPNGAGKSTLLKVASGLLAPESGEVRYFGEDVTPSSPHRRSATGLCHIPEGHAVYRRLTVRENLVMQARRGQEAAALERAVSAFPRLGERLGQEAGTMSGGEQQMLAMVRAYLAGQRVILVDEPSFGLAPILVESIFEFMERLRAESDVSVLVIDQFVERVLELAQTAYILRRGTVVFHGPAADLRGTDIFAQYVGGGRS